MDEQAKATRNDLRTQLLAKRPEPKSKIITLFGTRVEIRQPTIAAIMRAQEVEDPAERAAWMIIRYTCVPGTDERIFEEADKDMIMSWPFGEDMLRVQEAIAELSGINIEAATQELKTNPLPSRSSS